MSLYSPSVWLHRPRQCPSALDAHTGPSSCFANPWDLVLGDLRVTGTGKPTGRGVSAQHFLMSQDKPAGTGSGRAGRSLATLPCAHSPMPCWLLTCHPPVPFLWPSPGGPSTPTEPTGYLVVPKTLRHCPHCLHPSLPSGQGTAGAESLSKNPWLALPGHFHAAI